MNVTSGITGEIWNISRSEEPCPSRQIKFMSDMKGTLLECDLISVSSDALYLYYDRGDSDCFFLSNTEDDSSPRSPKKKRSRDRVSKLEKKTTRLLQQISPGAKLPRVRKSSKKKKTRKSSEDPTSLPKEDLNEDLPEDENSTFDENLEEEMEESSLTTIDAAEVVEEEDVDAVPDEEEVSTPIELIFQDENGEPYDEVKNTLNSTEEEPEISDEIDELKDYTADNSLPSDISEDNISLWNGVCSGRYFRFLSTHFLL
jgi:hypothetical protein